MQPFSAHLLHLVTTRLVSIGCSSLHFYSLKPGLTQPQMLVVTELDDPFVPAPDDLLVNLKDARGVVDALLDSLPTNFTSNQGVDSAMGPALQAAYLVMSHVGGKLLLFQVCRHVCRCATLPQSPYLGSLLT